MTQPVTADDVRAAAEALKPVLVRTPLLHSRALSEVVGGPVYLKCENVQRTGSYKIRGAFTRISRLSEDERGRGVVAASAGNHAQGVALAASLLGCKATIFMPQGAPLPKVEATRAYGSDIIFGGETVDACLSSARTYAEERGAVFIHPFDHPDIVAGQGTLGLELLEECPEARTVVAAVGGGGLISGLGVSLKSSGWDGTLLGVQAKRAAAFPASLAAGRPVAVALSPTMADGISVGRPGDLTFQLVSQLVDSVVTVSEESLSRAMLLSLERAKQVVEPAGAASVAAILEHTYAMRPPVVAVLSGGNIDPVLLAKVVRHGLVTAGRYLVVRVRLTDRPGALVSLLSELAEVGVNVLDVTHERVAARLHLEDAEVVLHLETRGPEHTQEVLTRLRRQAYTVKFT
ncbi:threonine ammonia-lyase [Actinocorallia sp. A-T 12471]|uniref:threonine ammonia-lyase n=1 Tax=Actinocorallia sp. A-T 12471 TaxID=3089813 RepID=UPI0029CFC864|nr:threonine ammonia-lyase [Actinocorallia sp. A-T 12471]MDX6738561.1 threonine ammonia-lyase [Actinocorallia sp. A-T 12471]